MFLQSVYHTKNVLRGTIYIPHITNATCYGIHVPSSGSYYNKGVLANPMQIYIYIIQSYTTSYFVGLYYIIIPATCFGSIIGPSSG